MYSAFVIRAPDGDVLVKVEGSYPPGRVEGGAIKFAETQLTRTNLSTGAQNSMTGNPMEIRREPDGRIEVAFVGEGAFTLRMGRRP